jgi:hypothetical protein
MNPHSYAHPTFDKGTKNTCGKKTAFSANVVEKSSYPSTKN